MSDPMTVGELKAILAKLPDHKFIKVTVIDDDVQSISMSGLLDFVPLSVDADEPVKFFAGGDAFLRY